MYFTDEKDYIMRMIKEMVRVLFSLMFGKKYVSVELEKENKYEVSGKNLKDFLDMIDSGEINEAENILLESIDYTDRNEVMAAAFFYQYLSQIPEFPEVLKNELIHCILAHHGELEYGSPKKPALVEAVALNLADNTDARMETITEIFAADKGKKDWLGFNRLFDSNLRRTKEV